MLHHGDLRRVWLYGKTAVAIGRQEFSAATTIRDSTTITRLSCMTMSWITAEVYCFCAGRCASEASPVPAEESLQVVQILDGTQSQETGAEIVLD